MRLTVRLACLLICFVTPATVGEQITQAALLRRMIDLDRLTVPPPPGERTGLFSSFDRRQTTVRDGRYVHWDANNDRGQFLRDTDRGWKMMAEVDGPGAITRIWCDRPAGEVRVILDGKTVIDAPLADLFNGALEPFGKPLSYEMTPGAGANSYFPIGFAKGCRVLSREFAGEYQIDYVGFPPETVVERFDSDLDPPAQSALDEIARTYTRGFSDRQLFGDGKSSRHAGQKNLEGGATFTWELKGTGTIRGFYVSLTDQHEPRTLHALHNCLLRIYWDGRDVPDVEVPLPAFFGTGFGRNLYNSLVMGTSLGTSMPGEYPTEGLLMYCYFPMPFSNGARIEIQNLNRKSTTIGTMLMMRVERQPPPPDALRFKVRMHTEDPCQTFDFPILETTGAGRLVGCALNIDCPREEWWGEGDHKIWIDDEPFPSILGTSTAGYFGNLPGLKPITMPLHGATRVSSFGKNCVYRWHIPDCVNFHRSLRFALENWQPEQANDVYYNTIAYWYGQPAAADSFQPVSPAALKLPGLRIPGAVEIEANIISDDWGNVLKEKYAGRVRLSGQAAAAIWTSQPVQVDLPWSDAGRYRLNLRVLTGRSFDTVSVADAAGSLIGTVEYSRQSNGTYLVGEISLQPGKTRLTVTCSKPTVLDCWVLEPVDD